MAETELEAEELPINIADGLSAEVICGFAHEPFLSLMIIDDFQRSVGFYPLRAILAAISETKLGKRIISLVSIAPRIICGVWTHCHRLSRYG